MVLALAPVVVFMLLPIFSFMLLSFNPSPNGGYPMTGFTTKWYTELVNDRAILQSLRTSLLLGVVSGIFSTIFGALAAYSLRRYWRRGAGTMGTLFAAPLIIPHVIIGVGVLLLFGAIGASKSFTLLVCGHVALTLPYVFTTMAARFARMPKEYEEAARSLGASQLRSVLHIVLPISLPAVAVSAVFAFAMSFDEVTATMFWKPANTETIQTQILAMQQFSLTPVVNALATVLILLTLLFPLVGWLLKKRFAKGMGE